MNLNKLKLKEKRYTVRFGESLFLRVYPTGVKSWVLRYCFKGTVKDLTIGHYPTLNLIQARHKSFELRKNLQIKPSTCLKFQDAYKLWKDKKKGAIVSYESECKRIEKHLMPYLKNMTLDEISAPMALNILLNIRDKLPTLKRVLMRLNEILELSVCAGLLKANPCRKLSKVFASHDPKHRPFIHHSKLGELFQVIIKERLEFQIYVIFCVYSALRPYESTIIKWSYLDRDTLTIPAAFMKKRRTHRLHIPHDLLDLLLKLKKLRVKRSVYVFNFGRQGSPYHKQHLSRYLVKNGFKNKLTHHGLRSTFRTFLTEIDTPFHVAEDAIAHLPHSQTERAYIRIDYLEQRRVFCEKWWHFITQTYCAQCAQNNVRNIICATLSAKDN